MDLVWETTSHHARSPSSSCSSIAEGTAGNDVSSFLNSREEAPSVELRSRYWIRVLHLESSTTDSQLKKMFYPYGADEAFTVIESSTVVGYVGFGMEEMAKLGVDKMNDFIPCGQTQALHVQLASIEDVFVARTKVCTKTATALTRPTRSFVSVLYSSASVRDVAAFIQASTDLAGIVADVAREISRASRTILERIMVSLTDVWIGWPLIQDFREGLLRQLLRLVLEATDRCPAQGANCGTAIGNLFVMHIVDGDPFQIASRLLQRGADSVVHVDSICLIARVCHDTPHAMSEASFWALVGSVAAQTPSTEVRAALLNNLHIFSRSEQRRQMTSCFSRAPPQMPLPFPTVATDSHSTDISFSHNSASQPAVNILSPPLMTTRDPQAGTAKSRTVYLSHLPPTMMQSTLMNYLLLAGPVNKVRICAGNGGHATLFAFVEMQSEAGARAAMRLNGVELMGAVLRVQTARNAVQDDVPDDAIFSPAGVLLKPCQFGDSRTALKDCIVRMPSSRA